MDPECAASDAFVTATNTSDTRTKKATRFTAVMFVLNRVLIGVDIAENMLPQIGAGSSKMAYLDNSIWLGVSLRTVCSHNFAKSKHLDTEIMKIKRLNC